MGDEQQIDPRLQQAYMMAKQQSQTDFLRVQIDNSDELIGLKMHLLGLSYDDKDNLVADPSKKPLMTSEGANILLGRITAEVSKITSMSNLSEERINANCKEFAESLVYMFYCNHDAWKVESTATQEFIIDMMDNILHSTYEKGLNGWQGRLLNEQHTSVESKEIIKDQRPQSFLGIPMNVGGNKNG